MTVVFYKFKRSVRAQVHHNRNIMKIQQGFHSVQQARKYVAPIVSVSRS